MNKRELDPKKGNANIVGKKVMFMANGTDEVWGIVELGYIDALASGRNEYVPIHQLLVKSIEDGKIYHLKPRYIRSVEENKPVQRWFKRLFKSKKKDNGTDNDHPFK